MSSEHAPSGRKNSDGSVDVWIRGRRVNFPGSGRAPTVEQDPAPESAGAVPSGVIVDPADAVTMVSYDGWYVRFTSEQVVVNRTKARRPIGRVFRRAFGRDGS